ncbi:MAG: helix-hairpin-helix domain-containing protein, partial [Bacteroidales bacterium]|nr:helix-hairpin-helix domain-containing protein [Bacteroidales bacterium]
EAETPAPLIDLNRSSAAGLERLPGIGPVLAARIIKYRNLLGGFVDSRQLTEVYGIDSSVVRLILPMVTVTLDSVSPLLLDSASFGDFARHPYVGYEAARVITRYRTLAEAPLTLGSMVRENVLTARQAERMAPYVRPSPGVAGTDFEFISSKVLK